MHFTGTSRCLYLTLFSIHCGYILSISDIDLKINNCSLYIQWKTLDMNVSCANYLVTVFENGNKRIDTHIASSKYIFDGIISAATYEVRVVCKENSTRLKLNSSPDTLKGTISAFPTMKSEYISAKESDNLTLRCPFFGAYSSSEILSWEYAVGLNYTSVLRNFQSTLIHLDTISYKDMGKYFCTMKYEECSNSSTQRQEKGFVFVTITGPPVILSANTSMSGTNDHIIHVKLELISFPDPTCKIRVEDDKHSGFIAKNCKLWTTVLAFKQIDKYIDVPGYILSFDIESIDSSFNESPELRIFVSNKEGTRKYEIRSNNSKQLNPFGWGVNLDVWIITYTTGSILCVLSVALTNASIYKSKKWNCSATHQVRATDISSGYENGIDLRILDDYTPLAKYEQQQPSFC